MWPETTIVGGTADGRTRRATSTRTVVSGSVTACSQACLVQAVPGGESGPKAGIGKKPSPAIDFA